MVATRSTLFEMIVDGDFDSKARQVTGKLFHKYLSDKVTEMLDQGDGQDE